MVKSKRDINSPRRKAALTVTRPVTRSNSSSPKGANIKVVIRVRPPNSNEQGDNSRIVVKAVDDQMLVFDPKENNEPFFYHGVQQRGRDLLKKSNKNMQFIFDKVFNVSATNNDIFQYSTKSLISALMDGYNCSVFVYGATGAGKTYTMLGYDNNPGITYLTMAELFKSKDELKNDREFELGITYLEIYNEMVQDLLNPGSSLHLREDARYGVTVAGIQVKRIENADDLFQLLRQGNQNRTQHPTDANAESSRSHAVFQVYLKMTIHATAEVRVAKLSMIDLAGSERGAATGCAGARFTEGANINKSLLALGNCINSLADGHKHVPYRDSKLTRLLKDSLGGNCQTIMIANVSPSSLSYEDTYNTLKYATRAKKIKSNVKKNVVNCEIHITQYIKMVEELNKENERLKKELEKNQVQSQVGPQNNELLNKLKTLYSDRKEIMLQLFRMESAEQILIKKRQLKDEANSRLSGFCVDRPQIEDGHKRLEGTMCRLQRQENCFKGEVVNLQHHKTKLEEQTRLLLEEAPYLKEAAKYEEEYLLRKEYELKYEHLEKMKKLYDNELQVRGNIMDRMTPIMQSCFMQLRGHGYATEEMIQNYHSLVNVLQGIKSVHWDNDLPDSGWSSSSSLQNEENVHPDQENNSELPTPLDNTFTKSTSKPSKTLNICTEKIMAKVYKSPLSKKVTRAATLSSAIAKENRFPVRRVIGTMGTAQRFPSAAITSKGIKKEEIRKPMLPVKQSTSRCRLNI